MRNVISREFKNYKTIHIFEPDYDGDARLINANHKFIKLLLKEDKHLDEIRSLIEQFFNTLNKLAREGDLDERKGLFEELLNIQREILNWLAERGTIEENDIDKYLLTKDDFPDYIFSDAKW